VARVVTTVVVAAVMIAAGATELFGFPKAWLVS
jgi:hypothetical protein